MCVFFYVFFHCFIFLSRYYSRHLGVLTRYLGVLTHSPVTTISKWVDKGMVAFSGGASDMSFHYLRLGTAYTSVRLVSQKLLNYVSFKIWFCLLHVRMLLMVPWCF